MNADNFILKQRTDTSYEVRFIEKNNLNEYLILQINEVYRPISIYIFSNLRIVFVIFVAIFVYYVNV